MLITLEETKQKINAGELLHIAATENLLKQLPKGNWIGGSTEYFMAIEGGKITGEKLFVTSFGYKEYKIKTYDANSIKDIANDAYNNGFTIAIIPFNTPVHTIYAEQAPNFDGMFIKNITGWISGMNLAVPSQTPISVDGTNPTILKDKVAALHICVPDDKKVTINVINIFEQDTTSPVIEFTEEGFSARTCLIDGKETVLADYITNNNLDTKLPLVGNYSGIGVNLSFKSMENGQVNMYAPVFKNIKYRIAKPIDNYAKAFNDRLSNFNDKSTQFSCNCILNFLYGELEGKSIECLAGPITFGEIAYQLVNQTLVYVSII